VVHADDLPPVGPRLPVGLEVVARVELVHDVQLLGRGGVPAWVDGSHVDVAQLAGEEPAGLGRPGRLGDGVIDDGLPV